MVSITEYRLPGEMAAPEGCATEAGGMTHAPAVTKIGRCALQLRRTAFPDIHFTVADLVAEGNRVAARWTLTGTQTGELRGRASTGQRVSVPGITVFHVVNGKIS
jgi:predicted ester cyclase